MNITELNDGNVSSNSDGFYWKLLLPGIYWVKAVVLSKDGIMLRRNEWFNALPIMQSVTKKVVVRETTVSQVGEIEEAKIVNFIVKHIE